MKFDEIKPGMLLYNKQNLHGQQIISWVVVRQVIRRKASDMVMIHDYWRSTSGRFYKDYDSEIGKYQWDFPGNIYNNCEPATIEQAKELIMMIFEKE